VRVSPTEDTYDPESIGVESVLINGDAPTFGSEHHLHLTTGDLSETSIFLGTDDHNVRTTTDGKIQITTPSQVNKVWEFGTNGHLTLPQNGQIKAAPGSSINLQTVGELSVTLTNESGTPMGPGSQTLTAALVDNPGVDTIQAGWIVMGTNLTETTTVVSVVDLGAGLYEITTDTTETDPFLYGSVYTFITLSSKAWEFGTDGNLTFPDNTVQTTAYQTGQQTIFVDETSALGTEIDLNSLTGTVILILPADGYTTTGDTHTVNLPILDSIPLGTRITVINRYDGVVTVNGWFGPGWQMAPYSSIDLVYHFAPEGPANMWWVTGNFIWD
jgi:hypothetical protein